MKRNRFSLLLLFSAVCLNSPAQAEDETLPVSGAASQEAVHESAVSPLEKYKGEWRGSMLFSVQEMENLRKMIALYENSKQQASGLPAGPESEDDALNALLNQASKEAEQNNRFFFPNFVLSTLVYLGPNDWLMVMNGRRITPQHIPESLRIVRVGQKSATFEWKSSDIQKFAARWNLLFPEGGPKPPSEVEFDRKQGVLRFTLKPNQRLSTEQFAIAERNAPLPKPPVIAEPPPAPAEKKPPEKQLPEKQPSEKQIEKATPAALAPLATQGVATPAAAVSAGANPSLPAVKKHDTPVLPPENAKR